MVDVAHNGNTDWCSDADNEDLLAAWFRYSGKRDKIFLCTKFGVTKNEKGPTIRSDAAYGTEDSRSDVLH